MWITTGLVCLLLAGGAPNFTGTWKLSDTKTQGATHRGTVFVIEHNEPALRYTATGTLKMGAPLSESYSFTTDGRTPRVPGRVQVIAHWEGSTLVMKYVSGEASLMTFTFRISNDGKELYRDAELKDGRRIHEVYERQ